MEVTPVFGFNVPSADGSDVFDWYQFIRMNFLKLDDAWTGLQPYHTLSDADPNTLVIVTENRTELGVASFHSDLNGINEATLQPPVNEYGRILVVRFVYHGGGGAGYANLNQNPFTLVDGTSAVIVGGSWIPNDYGASIAFVANGNTWLELARKDSTQWFVPYA